MGKLQRQRGTEIDIDFWKSGSLPIHRRFLNTPINGQATKKGAQKE